MVINAMEKIMQDLLDEYKSRLQLSCTCEQCLEDIMALTLNKTKPRYVTNVDKIMYIKADYVDKQQMTSLLVTLAECAKIVSDRPLCENSVKKVKGNEMSYM
ncbi:late competence development ComFB family protein [Metabacillus malikii]|uniref:Competence protein ComFB n=1 Tax=Metabacillus malikii TaxID=1504265 RepID=A0ABT9ZGN8_9BACI|nr:late competence development ComFB family protein [Metabacillus malikii]MDQ0231447.1 competence protein ComFB [Metabacillus malikii]